MLTPTVWFFSVLRRGLKKSQGQEVQEQIKPKKIVREFTEQRVIGPEKIINEGGIIVGVIYDKQWCQKQSIKITTSAWNRQSFLECGWLWHFWSTWRVVNLQWRRGYHADKYARDVEPQLNAFGFDVKDPITILLVNNVVGFLPSLKRAWISNGVSKSVAFCTVQAFMKVGPAFSFTPRLVFYEVD